jgi:hypothetical protein
MSADSKTSPPTYSKGASPPNYNGDPEQLYASLANGDPTEIIEVPMITRTGGMLKDSIHWLNPFNRKFGPIKTSVTTRKMPRDFYLKHYAKDAQGNYIGTAKPAPDAALVYVPNLSSPEDIQKQVDEVAYGKQQQRGGGIGKFGQPIQKE